MLKKTILALLLTVSALAACTSPPAATPTPTLLPAKTNTPTITLTKGLKITPMASWTPSITPLPYQSLPADETEEIIFGLLSTNAGCQLPCWWGITPGETYIEDAAPMLGSLGLPVSIYATEPLIIHEIDYELKSRRLVMIFQIFVLEDGLVEALRIWGSEYDNPSNFQRDWARFDPADVIKRFGTPTRVMVQTANTVLEAPVPEKMSYSIFLFYDELGFYVMYVGDVEYKAIYRFCPTFGPGGNLTDHIEIAVRRSNGLGTLDSLNSLLIDHPDYLMPLKEIADLSVEEFASLYSSEDPFCFEAPRDIWP